MVDTGFCENVGTVTWDTQIHVQRVAVSQSFLLF